MKPSFCFRSFLAGVFTTAAVAVVLILIFGDPSLKDAVLNRMMGNMVALIIAALALAAAFGIQSQTAQKMMSLTCISFFFIGCFNGQAGTIKFLNYLFHF